MKTFDPMQPFDLNLIPGMIEPVERELLRRLGRELPFGDNDCVVEFGAFFGKSTAFIAEGLKGRPENAPTLYTYDSFGCDSQGGFYQHVFAFADSGGVRDLVREENGRIDFLPVFNFYLAERVSCGAVVATRAELINSYPPPDKQIKLMHVDSPKMYVDFKPVLFRFLPRMKVGGVIIFQDFFYHWSASLIAAIGMLARLGFLEFRESAASSLVCVIRANIDELQALDLDLAMSSDDEIVPCIDYAISACEKISVDRPEIFLPRLLLAKIQWLMERGEGENAAGVIKQFFNSGGRLNQAILTDFIELIGHSFSMRRLYRLDHKTS